MEPDRTTAPELLHVLEELVRREPLFHRAEFGTTRADFARQISADFWETGASGRRYSRDFVLDTLEARWRAPHEDPWQATDFRCQQLAADLYLLTYTLAQAARLSRRSTLWRRHGEAWSAIYHQGTLLADAAGNATPEPT